MKTPRFLLLAGISLATMLTVSCDAINKALDETQKGLQESLKFDSLRPNNLLQGGGNQLGFMTNQEGVPDGDVDVITDVKIGGSALAGGSTIITVTASEELEELYIEIGGEDGYYRWNLEPEDKISTGNSAPFIYQIVLEFNQDQQIEEICETEGTAGVCRATRTFKVSGKTKEGELVVPETKNLEVKQVSTGALQISLSWDQNDDVDLYVYTPNGGKKIFFGNHRRDEHDGLGELDVDSNAGCTIDEINSENIFFEETPIEDGEYLVVAHLYQKCRSSTPGARYNVTVNGKLVTEKGLSFSDSAQGDGASLGSTPVNGANVKIIGKAIVENGQYKDFVAN